MIEESILASVVRQRDRFDMWADFVSKTNVRSIVEVGVWKGAFSRSVMERCEGISEYHLVDPWRNLPLWNKPLNVDNAEFEAAYEETVRNVSRFRDITKLWRGTSQEINGEFTDNSMDFIYIDGDHTLRGISIDLILWSAKVKHGFYIAGDDFCPTIWQHDPRYEPTLVFPFAVHFAEAMGYRIYGLPFNQFLIEINREGSRSFEFIDLAGAYRNSQLLDQINGRPGYMRRVLAKVPRQVTAALARWWRN